MKVETRRVSRRLWRILALRPLDNPIYSILYILSINNCATLNRTIFIRLSLMFSNLLSLSCKMEWRFDVFASLRTDGQWGFDELCEWSILFRARHRPFSFTALLGTFPLGSGFPYWKKQMFDYLPQNWPFLTFNFFSLFLSLPSCLFCPNVAWKLNDKSSRRRSNWKSSFEEQNVVATSWCAQTRLALLHPKLIYHAA